MAELGPEIVYPTLEQVIELNRSLIARYGGGDFIGDTNIHNEGPLAYMLDAISGSIFDRELYPSLKEKAAGLAHSVIAEHVFWDGN